MTSNLLTSQEVYNEEVTCVCGHSAKDHHLSMALGSDEGDYVVGECEYHGFNERGGQRPVGTWLDVGAHEVYVCEVTEFEIWMLPIEWEEHCMRFEREDDHD